MRGGQSEPPPPTYGNLEVSPSSLDFGELFVGDCLPKLFTLKNTGNADLVISDISLSDTTNFQITQFMYDCSTSGQTITSGDICNVLVNFCPSTSGTFDASLAISSSDPDTPTFNAQLTGSAKKLCDPPKTVHANNENTYGLFEGTAEIKEAGDTTTVDIDIKGTDIFPITGGSINFWTTIDEINFDSACVTDFGPNIDDAIGSVYAEKRIIAPGTHASFRARFCKSGTITFKLGIANLKGITYTMADLLLTAFGNMPVEEIDTFVNDISNPDDFPSINSAIIHIKNAMDAISERKIKNAYKEILSAGQDIRTLARDKNQLVKLSG